MKKNGYTLIEILIALLIFSILMTLISGAIIQVYTAQIRLSAADKAFMLIEKTMLISERDIEQIINRPVKNAIGRDERGLEFNLRDKTTLSFTRNGFNAFLPGDKNSQLQRVSYQLINGDLHRKTWRVTTPLAVSAESDQILLSNVENLQWGFVDTQNKQYPLWPPIEQMANTVPRGIVLTLNLANGILSRTFELPERTYAITSQATR